MVFKKRKKGIITVFALLLAACLAGGVFSVSAKYTSKSDSVSTFVQVSLMLDPNYTDAADSEWRTVSPVNGQAMPSVTPPSRDGYVFTGYYSADGSAGHEQNDGNRYYKNDGTSYRNWDASCNVLYAGWEGSFRITFDAGTNGGTIKDSTDTQKELYAKNGAKTLYTERNAAVTAAAPSAEHTEKDHYYFDGWYTSAVGGIKKVEYDGTVLSDWTGLTDDSTVLYARYKPYTYVVTFDKNTPAGRTITGTTADWVLEYGASASPLSANGFSGDGCTFRGWMISSDETSAQFSDRQSVTVDDLLSAGAVVTADADRTKKDITLYARWASVHTVTFRNMNSATGSVIATLYEFDGVLYTTAACTAPASIPSAAYSGRTESYWSTQNTGGGIIIDDGSVVANTVYTDSTGKWSLTEDITLYAVWYTVNYYKDTGAITDPEYTELQYIASTNGGKQYINTGIKPKDHIKNSSDFIIEFAMKPSVIRNDSYFYRAQTRDRLAVSGKLFSFRTYNGEGQWYIGYNGYLGGHSLSVGTLYGYTVTYKNSNISVQGSKDLNQSYTHSGFDNEYLLFFTGSTTDSGDFSSERLYRLKLSNNSASPVLKDFVPARRNSDGKVGLFDKANNEFNAGSGTFAAEYYTQVFAYGESGDLCPSVVPVSGRNDGKQADGLPEEQASGAYDCGYTSTSGGTLLGWSLFGDRPKTYDIGGTNAVSGKELWKSIEGTEGDLHVDLYTVWSDSRMLTSVFHSMNRNTEYVYVEPAAEEETE